MATRRYAVDSDNEDEGASIAASSQNAGQLTPRAAAGAAAAARYALRDDNLYEDGEADQVLRSPSRRRSGAGTGAGSAMLLQNNGSPARIRRFAMDEDDELDYDPTQAADRARGAGAGQQQQRASSSTSFDEDLTDNFGSDSRAPRRRLDSSTDPLDQEDSYRAGGGLGARDPSRSSSSALFSPPAQGRAAAGRDSLLASLGVDPDWDPDQDPDDSGDDDGLDDLAGGRRLGGNRRARPKKHKSEVERLREAWVTEKCCPELRAFAEEAVDAVTDQIAQQESILGALSADADTSEEEHFRLSLVTLDMERAKWLLRAYLRIRLIKIEEFSQFVSTAPPELRKLSEAERAYVQRFEGLRTEHLETSVLNLLPDNIRGLDDGALPNSSMGDMLIRPDLDSPVFIRSRVSMERPIFLSDNEQLRLTKGSIHLLRYSNIKHLLDRRIVELL